MLMIQSVFTTKISKARTQEKSILKINISGIESEICDGSLSLAHQNGINTILDDIMKFTDIKRLNLQNTEIDHLPESICNLKNLTELNLYGNLLKILPSCISILSNIKILNIGNNLFEEIPHCVLMMENLEKLILSNSKLTAIQDEITQLQKLKYLDLSGNSLKSLPNSIKNIASINVLNIRKNPDFIYSSNDKNTLGSLELIKIFGDRVLFDRIEFNNEVLGTEKFIVEYNRRSLHWNLDILKRLKLNEIDEIEYHKMIEIIENIVVSTEKDKNTLLVDKGDVDIIINYIRMLYNPKIDFKRWKIYDKYSMHMKRLFSRILMCVDKPKNADFVKNILNTMANIIKYNSIRPISSMKDVYVMIQNEFSYRDSKICNFIRSRLIGLKEYKFNVMMESLPLNDGRILNHWAKELGDILGLGLIFESETFESEIFKSVGVANQYNGGHLYDGLRIYLDNFTPDEIINILTDDINKKKELVDDFIKLIDNDTSLDALDKGEMVEFSRIKKDAVHHILTRMNILCWNTMH